MSNNTALINNKNTLTLNNEINNPFELWNDETKNKLISFLTNNSIEELRHWFSNKTLNQYYQIKKLSLENIDLKKLLPAWLLADIELLGTASSPVFSVMSPASPLLLNHNMSVAEAVNHVKSMNKDLNAKAAMIVDQYGRYYALLELHMLLKHDEDLLLADIALQVEPCHVGEDQEYAVSELQMGKTEYLPIVDIRGHPVGLFQWQQASQVMQVELTEDVNLQMGIQSSLDEPSYLDMSVIDHVRKRIIWVLGLAAVGIFSGMIIQSYDDAIAALTILALYMPMIADTGGNAGSQSATVIVRSLALGELKVKNWLTVVWKELKIASLIGLALAAASFIKVEFLSGSAVLPGNITLTLLGTAIALALFLQVLTATVIGATLPLIAKSCRLDPAVVASPAITTFVDITGLLIYFYITTTLLGI
ncbi:magnesium transporter [Moritella sp. Urea-trap-13]|uniref:magnesium transporter n=1 Tax=Moritella sp. Urea-trap-13 TaxID=2058327 RepID=UPI000C329DF3|nr:magnesium transporter [Moritella sp. Urea-trap-13]PKH08218.1 magnesium transporter [Moritella sp. Urea-trap-13]